jgi:hypothetical protein
MAPRSVRGCRLRLDELGHSSAALHFEQQPRDHQRGDADRRARICGSGQQVFSDFDLALPVARKINDKARHLENLIQPGSCRPQHRFDVLVGLRSLLLDVFAHDPALRVESGGARKVQHVAIAHAVGETEPLLLQYPSRRNDLYHRRASCFVVLEYIG